MEPLIFVGALALAWFLTRGPKEPNHTPETIASATGPAPTPDGASTGVSGQSFGSAVKGSKGGGKTSTGSGAAGSVPGKRARASTAAVQSLVEYEASKVVGYTKGGKAIQMLPRGDSTPVEVAK